MTHDRAIAERAPRVIEMRDGRIEGDSGVEVETNLHEEAV